MFPPVGGLCNTRWRRKEKGGEEMDEEATRKREKIKGVLTCWTE
jgi:hypothetical protein